MRNTIEFWLVSTLLVSCSLAQAEKAPRLLALSIGINEYASPTVKPLEGAINDAHAIHALARDLGAVMNEKLIGPKATKAAVSAAWQNLVQRSRPGDVILLSFAGHGTRKKLAQPDPSEVDGHEEYSVLYGKDELMSGDEWNTNFALAQGRTVVFLNDSCYAEGQTRTIAGNEVRNTPTAGFPPIPQPAKRAPPQRHVVALAAVDEVHQAPEISYEGRARGALTVAFEFAIRGDADRAGDGLVQGSELANSVRRKVETLTGLQGLSQKTAFDLNDGAGRNLFRALPLPKPSNIGAMRVAVEAALPEYAPFNQTAVPRAGSEFLWNQRLGVVYRTKEGWGHPVLYQVRSQSEVELEVWRWRLIEALQAQDLPITVQISSEIRSDVPLVLADQEQGIWSLTGVKSNSPTVINISSGGKYYVFPPNKTIDRFKVETTFGVDHLLVIEWLGEPDPNFTFEQGVGMRELNVSQIKALEALSRRKDIHLGLTALYTCPTYRNGKCENGP